MDIRPEAIGFEIEAEAASHGGADSNFCAAAPSVF
jgi:hypothetical protein